MPLPAAATRLQVLIGWEDVTGETDIDGSALLLNRDRQVVSDEDFVFYNHPDSADGSVRHQGRTTTETGTEERVFVDLEATRDEVEVIAIAASAYRGTFGQIEALRLLLLDMAGEAVASFRIDNATRETALLLGEIYRHAGDWKMRAVGQGWESGLAGLISEFGVTVDTDEAEGSDERSETVAADAVDAALVTTAGPVTDPALGAAAEADTSIDEELVDVAPLDSGGALATVTHLSTAVVPRRDSVEETRASPADATLLAPRRGGGVKTRKTSSKVVTAPAIQLAGGEGWQPARVFSIHGSAPPRSRRNGRVLHCCP